jgi:hypothetical protein
LDALGVPDDGDEPRVGEEGAEVVEDAVTVGEAVVVDAGGVAVAPAGVVAGAVVLGAVVLGGGSLGAGSLGVLGTVVVVVVVAELDAVAGSVGAGSTVVAGLDAVAGSVDAGSTVPASAPDANPRTRARVTAATTARCVTVRRRPVPTLIFTTSPPADLIRRPGTTLAATVVSPHGQRCRPWRWGRLARPALHGKPWGGAGDSIRP